MIASTNNITAGIIKNFDLLTLKNINNPTSNNNITFNNMIYFLYLAL